MNGRIVIDSEPGQGATFSFDFDVEAEDTTAVPVRGDFRGQRVGLIYGDGMAATLMERRLRDFGCVVANLSEDAPGRGGLPAAAERDPAGRDVAQCDILLADHGSLADPVGWLSRLRDAGVAAPVIIMVTPAERGQLARLRQAGFDAYLVKPVRSVSLAKVMAALVAGEPVGEGDAAWRDEREAFGSRAKSLRMLVAEDNDINLMLTTALLRKHGHEPVIARDGETALALIRRTHSGEDPPFSAVFMDLHMPGIDGLEAIRRIREAEQAHDLKVMPIFALTADVTARLAGRGGSRRCR